MKFTIGEILLTIITVVGLGLITTFFWPQINGWLGKLKDKIDDAIGLSDFSEGFIGNLDAHSFLQPILQSIGLQ